MLDRSEPVYGLPSLGAAPLSLAAASLLERPIEDLLGGSQCAAATREADIGGVASNDRRNVDREGLGPGGRGHEIGERERQRVPIVAHVGMHHVAAMQVDAGAGEV